MTGRCDFIEDIDGVVWVEKNGRRISAIVPSQRDFVVLRPYSYDLSGGVPNECRGFRSPHSAGLDGAKDLFFELLEYVSAD